MSVETSNERSKPIMTCRRHLAIEIALLTLLALFAGKSALAEANRSNSEQEVAYTQAIHDRAERIVGTLGIDDSAKAARVRDLIARQYRRLRKIHDARDAKIEEARKSPAADRTLADAWIKVARDQANLKLVELHRHFVARLSVGLTPQQG